MAKQSNDTPLTKADLKEVLGKTEVRLKQYVDEAVTNSQEEVLEAVTAGFSRMQQSVDQRFDQAAAERVQMKSTLDEHTKRLENIEGEVASINQKLTATIELTDTHDRRLKQLVKQR